MAFVGVEVAEEREVGAAAFGGGDVGDEQVGHRPPVVLRRPGRVAQRDFGNGADPVAVGEVVVVDLFDREELVGIAGHAAERLVVVEVAVPALAGEPLLDALLDGAEQLVARRHVPLLLGNVHQLHVAQQALALPIGALAFLQHHPAGVAQVGLQQVFEFAQPGRCLDAGPVGHEAGVGVACLEALGSNELDGPADAVEDRSSHPGRHRLVVEPVVRVQAEQGAVVGPFHRPRHGLEVGGHGAARGVIAPIDTRVLDEGIGVAREQGQRLGLGVGQGRGGDIPRAGRQAGDPLGGRHRFPAHAGRAEDRIRLALELQRQHPRVGSRGRTLRGGGQGQPKVAPCQTDARVRAAVGYRDPHVVGALRHGDVDGPVARLGQLGRPRLEGHGRQQQRVTVRVADLDIAPDGRRHLPPGERELQPGGRGLHGDGLDEDRVGLGIEDQRGVPLVGLRSRLQQGLGAQGRGGHALVATLRSQKVGGGPQLHRLRQRRHAPTSGAERHGHDPLHAVSCCGGDLALLPTIMKALSQSFLQGFP